MLVPMASLAVTEDAPPLVVTGERCDERLPRALRDLGEAAVSSLTASACPVCPQLRASALILWSCMHASVQQGAGGKDQDRCFARCKRSLARGRVTKQCRKLPEAKVPVPPDPSVPTASACVSNIAQSHVGKAPRRCLREAAENSGGKWGGEAVGYSFRPTGKEARSSSWQRVRPGSR